MANKAEILNILDSLQERIRQVQKTNINSEHKIDEIQNKFKHIPECSVNEKKFGDEYIMLDYNENKENVCVNGSHILDNVYSSTFLFYKTLSIRKLQCHQEYISRMREISEEINDADALSKFFSRWKEQISNNSELQLKDYPTQFYKCFNNIKDSKLKIFLSDELKKIKPINNVAVTELNISIKTNMADISINNKSYQSDDNVEDKSARKKMCLSSKSGVIDDSARRDSANVSDGGSNGKFLSDTLMSLPLIDSDNGSEANGRVKANNNARFSVLNFTHDEDSKAMNVENDIYVDDTIIVRDEAGGKVGGDDNAEDEEEANNTVLMNDDMDMSSVEEFDDDDMVVMAEGGGVMDLPLKDDLNVAICSSGDREKDDNVPLDTTCGSIDTFNRYLIEEDEVMGRTIAADFNMSSFCHRSIQDMSGMNLTQNNMSLLSASHARVNPETDIEEVNEFEEEGNESVNWDRSIDPNYSCNSNLL